MDEIVESTPTSRLRPFWGRIMVIPSTVDEEQRASGLVLPIIHEHSPVKRGVVAHVDRNVTGEVSAAMEEVGPGTVVYYIGGWRVLDSIMLERGDIVAYEVDDSDG